MSQLSTTYSFSVSKETESPEEMSELLRHIANLIDEGYSSGYDPYWTMNRSESTN